MADYSAKILPAPAVIPCYLGAIPAAPPTPPVPPIAVGRTPAPTRPATPGRDIVLGADGDMDLTGGGYLTTGQEAIRQEARLRLRTGLGEYFLDLRRGMPWATWTSTKATGEVLRQVEAYARAQLLGVLGVKRVVACSAVWDNLGRRITLTASVVTDEDELLELGA